MSLTLLSLISAFAVGFMGLALNRTHLLSALLCLEGMMLTIFISLSLWTLFLETMGPSSMPMLVLAFSACEASAGLALLVATARTHGTDHMPCFTLLQC
nr:NADH dehydrogenase subunit 4L [Argyropelecus hemigymnus]